MIVTIYELLGMVKDGKAPKKIKYINKIFDYDNADYFNTDIGYLFERCTLCVILNDKVEILEEKKTPEKWNDLSFTTMRKREDSIDDDIQKLKGYIETIMRTQNQVIDYLKSKGE